jgi:hypothetical protein
MIGSHKHFLSFVLLVLVAASAVSCRFLKSDVDTVRNGVLADYNTTTVGKAFEGTFQNAKWRSFETAKGETVVEFQGTMKLPQLVETFGCSPACQKQLETLHDECVGSEHTSDATASIAKANQEPKEELDRSVAELQAQIEEARNKITQIELRPYTPSILDNPNLPMYDRAGKPINYQRERAIRAQEEAAKKQGVQLLGDQMRALDEQIRDLQSQYQAQNQAQNSASRQQREEL